MLESELKKVPLLNLRDGAEYPLGNINMRKGPKGDLGALRASLREQGQLQNMVGSTYGDGDEVYLLIGNRRREAAQQNQDESPKLALNLMDVKVYRDISVADALEIALMEKIPELPHHEVDQFEAFEAQRDKDPAEIAAHFACSERLVRQRMKLGALSEKIRKAWRAGEIDRKTAEAFTMAKDVKAQDKAFEALKRTHGLYPQAVRARLLPGQEDVQRFLHFASAEFTEAGGQVITDLFNDNHGVSDAALLKRVAEEKLAGICATFISEHGFAWAKPEGDMPTEWHGWKEINFKVPEPGAEDAKILQQLEAVQASDDSTDEEARAARVERGRIDLRLELDGLPAKDRAKSGAVLSISGDGGLDWRLGVVEPKPGNGRVLEGGGDDTPPTKREPERAAGEPPEEKVPGLSFKSQGQRAVELTSAAAHVLRECPDLALVILLAGLADRGSYGAIRASVNGSEANALHLMESDNVADNVPRLKGMNAPALQKMAASAAAAAIVFQAHSAERAAIEDDGVRAILSLLPKDKLAKALANHFDPDDYFSNALPKELALEAIRENCGQAVFEAQRDGGFKPGEIRVFAATNLKPDWLPPSLRFPGYAGPGAKPAKAKKPSAKTKTKAKPKAAAKGKRK